MKLFDQKVVFFGGKGGVGKTSCASACALLASQKGLKTLLISTDPAHSLSDLFGIPIGPHEKEIQPGLFALEIDPDHEAAVYVEQVKTHLRSLVDPESSDLILKQMDHTLASPGTQEAALLDKMTQIIAREDQPYDLLVFDTAPTGQTLRLLTLPELMEAWTNQLVKRRKKVSSLWHMFSRSAGQPIEDDPVLRILDTRRERYKRARQKLTDPKITGLYLVLIPEKLPIQETERAVSILKKHGFPISGMIINRLLPDDVEGAFLQKRKHQERLYLKEIAALFHSFNPVFLYQKETDVMNLEGLRGLSRDLDRLLNRVDPTSL